MRITPFKNVVDSIIRLHGRDPRENLTSDIARTLVDHFNSRVRTIWHGWRWPEWEITEERAFRPIFDSTEQYLKVSTENGLPDEVFYLGDNFVDGGDFTDNYGYYVVKSDAPSDPPIDSKPTDTVYWEALDPVDTFIQYDQRDRRPIGEVLGVYSCDPRTPTGRKLRPSNYTPSEKGIDVSCVGVPTVFVTHKMVCPKYSLLPFAVGRTYFRGEVVFNPDDSECYEAIRDTTQVPVDVTVGDDWIHVPFLDVWEDYVVSGVFADSLMEFDQGGNGELQAKMVLVQYWNQNADDALQAEVDALSMQGQKLQWRFCRNKGNCCQSQPWTGGMVSLIGQ